MAESKHMTGSVGNADLLGAKALDGVSCLGDADASLRSNVLDRARRPLDGEKNLVGDVQHLSSPLRCR